MMPLEYIYLQTQIWRMLAIRLSEKKGGGVTMCTDRNQI